MDSTLIKNKHRSHTITVVVDGGLVQQVRDIPPGIEIRVIDYDVEGREQLQVSPLDGEACLITTHS